MMDRVIGGKYGVWKNMGEIITSRKKEFGGCCYCFIDWSGKKKAKKAKSD